MVSSCERAAYMHCEAKEYGKQVNVQLFYSLHICYTSFVLLGTVFAHTCQLIDVNFKDVTSLTTTMVKMQQNCWCILC